VILARKDEEWFRSGHSHYHHAVAEVLTKNVIPNRSKKLKNVKSLCLTKHHAMKTYWGVKV
jgi:hypothetical protein